LSKLKSKSYKEEGNELGQNSYNEQSSLYLNNFLEQLIEGSRGDTNWRGILRAHLQGIQGIWGQLQFIT